MYVSIDIETTGLDVDNFQILEVAAVAWTDDDINKCLTFEMVLDPRLGPKVGNYGRPITGDPYALAMNTRLLEIISGGMGASHTMVMDGFAKFIHQFDYKDGVRQRGKHLWPVGQNFGSFDWQFLKKLPAFPVQLFSHRFTEVGTFMADRDGPHSGTSDFDRIAEKYNIEGETHQALFDAKCTLAKLMETLDA